MCQPETLNSKNYCNENRLKAEMRVYYGKSHELLLTGYTVDISSGGLYIRTNIPLNVGDSLTLKFSLPGGHDDQVVLCRGSVAWVNDEKNLSKKDMPPGMGVEFKELSKEDFASISSFVDIEGKW